MGWLPSKMGKTISILQTDKMEDAEALRQLGEIVKVLTEKK